MREAEKYKDIVDGMSKLFADKNADYGNTFDEMFQKYGIEYFTIMVSQKMSRIDGVLRSGKNNFESIEDSFRDAANYCVLALMCLDKAKDDGMQKYSDSQEDGVNKCSGDSQRDDNKHSSKYLHMPPTGAWPHGYSR